MPGKSTLRDRIDRQTEYATALSGPIPEYLLHIERQTHLKTIAPQMMSGRLQGRVLAMLSTTQRPRRILELGTFTAYATLCLAEGLTPGGMIDTIEGDKEMAHLAREHIVLSPYTERIQLLGGQATELLQSLPGPYDLIFLDADKRAYPDYFSLLVDRLAPGGLLLTDNVLWDGKMGDKKQVKDADALHRYNHLVFEDERLSVVILPLRDGLSVARRK